MAYLYVDRTEPIYDLGKQGKVLSFLPSPSLRYSPLHSASSMTAICY